MFKMKYWPNSSSFKKQQTKKRRKIKPLKNSRQCILITSMVKLTRRPEQQIGQQQHMIKWLTARTMTKIGRGLVGRRCRYCREQFQTILINTTYLKSASWKCSNWTELRRWPRISFWWDILTLRWRVNCYCFRLILKYNKMGIWFFIRIIPWERDLKRSRNQKGQAWPKGRNGQRMMRGNLSCSAWRWISQCHFQQLTGRTLVRSFGRRRG